MPKRYFPIAVLTAILAAVAIFGYLTPPESEAEIPKRILLDNSGGKVVFNHVAHARDYKVDCKECHHEVQDDPSQSLPCGDCHGVDVVDTWVEEHITAFTQDHQCATCHHVEFERNTDWGHDMHVENDLAACTDCHHDESTEPEPTDCGECHDMEGSEDMPGLRDAAHERCKTCHEDLFEEGLAGCESCHVSINQMDALKAGALQEDFSTCTSCHQEKSTNELLMNRMNAFHAQCMGCHQKEGKGPFEKDQCNQCHYQ